MNPSLEPALLSLFVLLLVPLVLYSLWAGSPIPNGPAGAYFRAVRGLRFSGDVFLVFVCAMAILKLAAQFNFVEPARAEDYLLFLSVPFTLLLFVHLAFLAKAVLRVHGR